MGYSSIRDPNGSSMPRLAARAYPLMEGGAEPSESPSKAERTGYAAEHGPERAPPRAPRDATAQPHRARHATADTRQRTSISTRPTHRPVRIFYPTYASCDLFLCTACHRHRGRGAAARGRRGGRFVPCSGFRRAPSFWRSFLRINEKKRKAAPTRLRRAIPCAMSPWPRVPRPRRLARVA